MSNEMWTDLPQAGSAQLTDIICAVQGYSLPSLGTSVQQTWQQVFNLFNSNNVSSFAGNPNGFVAGRTYQFLWDSTDKILWVCTTTGTALTAVWTKSIQLTGGTGISINQSGSTITISSAAGGLSWNNVLTTSALMVSNNAYVANNASLVTLNLPTSSSFGDVLYVTGIGAGGWTIVYASGQSIQIGSVSSTITIGSVSSTNTHDAINLVCTLANTTWQAFNGPIGNLTIV